MTEQRKVDWGRPIEAVHEDGRVVPVKLVHSLAFGPAKPDCDGHYWTTGVDDRMSKRCWEPDGSRSDIGWRIRNVAELPGNSEQLPTLPDDLTARMVALVKEMTTGRNGNGPVRGWDVLVDEARALVAVLEPVDGDLIEAREAVIAAMPGQGEAWADAVRKGELDDGNMIHIARTAIRRALERGEG